MSQISRLHQAEIANGNLIDADDISDELDQLVTQSNGQDTRLTNIESSAMTLAGVKTFSSAPKTDQIDERTPAAGVTLDGVLHKDGYIKTAPATQPYVPAANGEFGLDTTNGAYKGMIGGSVVQFAMVPGYAGLLAKTSAYTLLAADKATVVSCTGTFTLSFSAAATLGTTWFCSVKNDGTGIITLDPNSAETIDGVATIKMFPGEAFQIFCDGTVLRTVGRLRGEIFITSQTASASSTIDFTANIDSEFDEYIIKIANLVPGTNDTGMQIRVSENAGSSWKTTAGDYSYSTTLQNAVAASGSGSSIQTYYSTATTMIANASPRSAHFNIRFFRPSASTGLDKYISGIGSWYASNGTSYRNLIFSGHYLGGGTPNPYNGIRFLMSSGNIASGLFELYGFRK